MNVHNSSLRPVDLDEFERELREIASSSVAKKVGDPLAELARMVGREVSVRGKPNPRVDGWEAPARGQGTRQAIGGEKAWQYSDSDHAQADVPAEAVAIPADRAPNAIERQDAHGHDLADGASGDAWADPYQEYEASQHEDEFVYVGEPNAPSVGRRVSDALPRQRAPANASWRSLVQHRPFAFAGALALIVIGVSAAALALFTQMDRIDGSAPATRVEERPVKAEPVKVADDQAPPVATPSASFPDRPSDTAAAPLAIAVAAPTSAQDGAVAASRPPAFVVASAGPAPIAAAPALPQPSPPAAAAAALPARAAPSPGTVSPTPLPVAAATSPPGPRPTSAQNAVPDPATPAAAEAAKPEAGPDANTGTPPTIGQKIVEGTTSNLSKGAVPAGKEKAGEKDRLAPTASSAKPAGASSYSVKLASSVTEKDARLTMMQLQKEFPGALARAYVRREDLGSEGVFYRVRVGPLSREAAEKLCSQVKAAGKTCTSVVGHTGA